MCFTEEMSVWRSPKSGFRAGLGIISGILSRDLVAAVEDST